MAAGPPVETPKSKKAWLELVKALRKRGPASKSDPSLAAGLMRLTGAGGERSLACMSISTPPSGLVMSYRALAIILFCHHIALVPHDFLRGVRRSRHPRVCSRDWSAFHTWHACTAVPESFMIPLTPGALSLGLS